MSLLMGVDSIARCAAQYRSERLAALGLKSCHASYLMGICDCREFLRSSWPGGLSEQKQRGPAAGGAGRGGGLSAGCAADSDRRVTELYPTEQAEAARRIRQVLGQWESWVTQDLTQATAQFELLLGS